VNNRAFIGTLVCLMICMASGYGALHLFPPPDDPPCIEGLVCFTIAVILALTSVMTGMGAIMIILPL
jgi:hypothetical protein